MMTRKHFEAIAQAFRKANDHPDLSRARGPAMRLGIDISMFAVADELAKFNPNFDRERFLAACEGE